MNISVKDIQRAWEVQNPHLPDLITDLVNLPNPVSEKELPEEVLTLERYMENLFSQEFKELSLEERRLYRQEQMKILEADDAPVPLPERFKIHDIILKMWQKNGPYERECLLQIIFKVPLKWGPWRALKRIFKEAEAKGDLEIFAALTARLDMERAAKWKRQHQDVRQRTLGYLCRRAWRYLKRIGESLPACYADTAVAILSAYRGSEEFDWGDTSLWSSSEPWGSTWVANHIFYHEAGEYSRRRFQYKPWGAPSDKLTNRAFPHLWRRSPRPLLTLLERAQCDHVRSFAVAALQTDFPTSLRDVESLWVIRLLAINSPTIDAFVVWLLKNIPKFEQGSFATMGLHEPILKLLESENRSANQYAAKYALSYARDLSVKKLISLVDSHCRDVRDMAVSLLQERDPRKDVGLDNWGELLETSAAHQLATDVLCKHFNAKELTPQWFKKRLFSHNCYSFAIDNLCKFHTLESLTPQFFCEIVEDEKINYDIIYFVLDTLRLFDAEKISIEFIKRALLHSIATANVLEWINEEFVPVERLGASFLKMLAYHPLWDSSKWVEELKQNALWAKELEFNEELAYNARTWLKDFRKFTPKDLEFSWLMELVEREEKRYYEFAVTYLSKAFAPADFAKSSKKKSEDLTTEGCKRLWELATSKTDSSLSLFAVRYLKNHHLEISRELGNEVSSETQIPKSFLSFKRVQPLLADSRPILRELALEFCKWELARWQPVAFLTEICEIPHQEVKDFFTQALLADDSKIHNPYRINCDLLTVEIAYGMCSSFDETTRILGMKLIEKNPRLAIAEELFLLTETPDRKVLSFVVRTLWKLYQRDKEIKLPSGKENLYVLLRKMLFDIPLARFSKETSKNKLLDYIPARKTKRYLIDVMRDLALNDREFAQFIVPLLQEFLASYGKSEKTACLVALVRLKKKYNDMAIDNIQISN